MQMLSYAWVTDVCIQLYLNCNLLRCLVTLIWRCSVILGMDVLKLVNAKGFGGMLKHAFSILTFELQLSWKVDLLGTIGWTKVAQRQVSYFLSLSH